MAKNLVVFSTSYWLSPLKFRRHQWATIASENGYKVTYVNPTFTLLSFIQDEDAKQIFWAFLKRPLQVNENLRVLTMPPLLPFQRKFLWIDKINRKMSRWILKRKLRALKSDEETIFIVYEPTDLYRKFSFPNSLWVYECVDEHSEYPIHHKVKEKIIEIEKELIEKSDILSVSSFYLLQKKKLFNPNNIYIPNGVNFNLFNSSLKEETKIASDIDSIPGPIILYVGAIMEWFDYELLLKIAENQAWNIVLIGPQTVNSGLFKDRKNIYSLGVKNQSQLPEYLKKADVCIIPFIVNDLVKGVNPLKLYEYLAAGKPVVSTSLPDVIALQKPNYIHIGRDHKEFIEHLSTLLRQRDNNQRASERAEMARGYSWENLYKKLVEKIDSTKVES